MRTFAKIVAVFAFFALGMLTTLHAQSPSPTPQWQIDAGSKMAFDVASVKQNKSGPSRVLGGNGHASRSNFPISANAPFPSGGYFAATNVPLIFYINIAYKLTQYQVKAVRSQLPQWAVSDQFDIEARAQGNPNKDQIRLMLQDLLTNRFKLAAHFETKHVPVFDLVTVKAGQMGSQLKPHSQGPSCDAENPSDSANSRVRTAVDAFPSRCGVLIESLEFGHFRMGARDVPVIADDLMLADGARLDRPVQDQTELDGTFDFVLEFTPDLPPSASFQPDASGPNFLEALKEQLGLKLVPHTGPVDVLVIDHIEEPSAN